MTPVQLVCKDMLAMFSISCHVLPKKYIIAKFLIFLLLAVERLVLPAPGPARKLIDTLAQ